MINIYSYEKKAREQYLKERGDELEAKRIEKRKDERDFMIDKYKKRIRNFIDNMSKKPQNKADDYIIRLKKAEKSFYRADILGDESFRRSFKLEGARIAENVEKNKILDLEVNEILDKGGDVMRLRERNKSKEIVK